MAIRKNGDKINTAELSRQLGCKIVEISALKGTGVKEAAEAAIDAAQNGKTVPMHTFSGCVEHAIAHIEAMLGAMLACLLLDGGQKKTPAGWLWRITALAALLWCFRFDYGIRGIFLICAFFLFPARKTAWIAAVAVFGAWSAQRSGWSTDSLIYLLGYCAALIPLLLSDGSRGSGPRRLFYIFYPAHLAVLGVIQQLLLRL